jgi:hypothetical protein
MNRCPRPSPPRTRCSPTSTRGVRLRRARLGLIAPLVLLLSGCSDFVILHPTPVVNAPIQSLPPIGFNHRYGNNPVTAADGFNLEHALFSQLVFWEVGVRTDPQSAGFVDRTNPGAVAAARAHVTAIEVALATERLATIHGMLASPTDAGQEQYCIGVINFFRALGYSGLTKATVLVFFTEQDEHAMLSWTPAAGYSYRVFDNNLRGNPFRPGPTATPLPSPA